MAAPVTEQRRKRLSIGQIDLPEGFVQDDRPENPRGMLNFLKNELTSTLDAAEEAGKKSLGVVGNMNRRASLTVAGSSDGAKKGAGQQQKSFDDKKIVCEADSMEMSQTKFLAQKGMGIKCKKGKKPEAPNQDSFAYIHNESEETECGAGESLGFTLYGVFDGHGLNGHDVSNFVRDALPKLVLSDPNLAQDMKKALQQAFVQTQILIESDKNLDARTSGSTATMAILQKKNEEEGDMLHVAHVADSRAILVCENAKGKVFGHPLTQDHKPDLPEEKKRIEENNGTVIFDGFYNYRVFAKGKTYPGLNMSRALGDVAGHKDAGISAVPDVVSLNLKPRADGVKFLALMLCSDGVWEFINDDQAAQMVCKFKKGGKIDPDAASEHVCQQSWNLWMEDTGNEISDDITCMIQVF